MINIEHYTKVSKHNAESKILKETMKVLDDFHVPKSMYDYDKIVYLANTSEISLSNYIHSILVNYLNKFD